MVNKMLTKWQRERERQKKLECVTIIIETFRPRFRGVGGVALPSTFNRASAFNFSSVIVIKKLLSLATAMLLASTRHAGELQIYHSWPGQV